MRVAIASISLESNTFNPVPVRLDDFRAVHFLEGDAVFQLRDSQHELGGMLTELSRNAVEVVPILAAGAGPGGCLAHELFDELLNIMQKRFATAGPLDGVLLAPHGAMVTEQINDADGHWMACIRDWLGPTLPIIATCDPHANVSRKMVAATDALLAYQTNPHLDQFAKGQEAAALMMRTLRGEIFPTQAVTCPPIAIGIERQHTTEEPCASLFQAAAKINGATGVLATSIILGFPYADVAELGSAAIVVTDRNPERAQALSDQLAHEIWQRRHKLVGEAVCVAEAVRQCQDFSGCVCLLDMGDNVGGGSPGDGTALLHEFRRQSVGPALAVLHDPDAVASAIKAGVGFTCSLEIGGKSCPEYGPPYTGEFEVVAISDGIFHESVPRHGGLVDYDQGPTAVVQNGWLTVMLTSRRQSPFSLQQVLHAGIDPTKFRAIVAKGVHAPVAAYREVCPMMLRVDTPGITAADMRRFDFHNRRRPMFPFEADTSWTVADSALAVTNHAIFSK